MTNRTATEPAATLADTRNLVEQAWHEALGPDQVFRDDDDFFEIGGHSVLALHVAGALGEALGQEVSVRILFEATRLDELTAAIHALRA
jgi:hypothetical protein